MNPQALLANIPFAPGFNDSRQLADSATAWMGQAFWARNTLLDYCFYDVAALTAAEIGQLARRILPQGTVLIVHPASANAPLQELSYYDFIERKGEAALAAIDTLVIPGVGSTALGAAAMARDVANHAQRPVAALVSGYGGADLAADALGGWFVLGANNALRDLAQQNRRSGNVSAAAASEAAAGGTVENVAAYRSDWPSLIQGLLGNTSEIEALGRILRRNDRIKWLIGHSKGGLSIAFVLFGLDAARRKQLQVITLGCATHFPADVVTHQFVGELDWLGMVNSRGDVPFEPVAGSGHSLNQHGLPTAMPVAQLLARAGLN